MLPARGQAVSDTTPAISAVVSDPETEVNEGNVAVYMDGKKFSGTRYAYDPNTDRLSGTSTRLSKGESHTFKVVASDRNGQKTTRSTKFSVRR
jgi:hypothetical protein